MEEFLQGLGAASIEIDNGRRCGHRIMIRQCVHYTVNGRINIRLEELISNFYLIDERNTVKVPSILSLKNGDCMLQLKYFQNTMSLSISYSGYNSESVDIPCLNNLDGIAKFLSSELITLKSTLKIMSFYDIFTIFDHTLNTEEEMMVY